MSLCSWKSLENLEGEMLRSGMGISKLSPAPMIPMGSQCIVHYFTWDNKRCSSVAGGKSVNSSSHPCMYHSNVLLSFKCSALFEFRYPLDIIVYSHDMNNGLPDQKHYALFRFFIVCKNRANFIITPYSLTEPSKFSEELSNY